ncbi:MAG: hypothetical protein FWE14_08045 [Lachnospiraceae bacterium]|nr:hypothetical protein [Lachnospiraceae bacterium]
MDNEKILSIQNLENLNYKETKKNIIDYFYQLERLKWELAKLNAQKGLVTNYDFITHYQKQPFIPVGKDGFNISAKEDKEEQLKKYISSYCWAKSILTNQEQIYIEESFINHKYDEQIIEILGFGNIDENEFRKIKRNAVYKLADFLELAVEKEESYGKRKVNC